MIKKSKKVIVSMVMVMALTLSGVVTTIPKVDAADNRNTGWASMYSTPNYQNSYGRCWYGTNGVIQKYYICMDSYYTQGSSASLTYRYYPKSTSKNYKTVKRSQSSSNGDSKATYVETASVLKGTYYNTVFYAAARGFSMNRTQK